MAELNIAQPMRFKVDVRTGLVEQPQRESLMKGDKNANRIIVELVNGSEPVDITGVTVKGKFCRPPDLDEIVLSGTAEGNLAIVQLTDACYTTSGNYEATVSLVLDDVERTVLFISGTVLQSGSGSAAGEEGGGSSGTGSGLPSGGTAGQVLVKVSSAEGAAIWETLTAADVGALGKNETAVNADKLNGKSADYYAKAVPVISEISEAEAETSAQGHLIDAYVVKQLLDRFVTETATVEMDGAYASGNVTIKKSGNVVSVMVPNTRFSNLATGADNIIATIPAAYKPSSALFYVIKNDRGTMYIGTGGQIVLLPTAADIYAEAFFTYVI